MKTFLFPLIFSLAIHGWAESAQLNLSLERVEQAAQESSANLQSAKLQAEAAGDQAWVAMTGMLPRLSIQGSWRYQTVVPSFALVLHGPVFQFGDNTNYSIGPQLDWNLWDSGAAYNQWRSSQAVEKSQWSQYEAQKKAILLQARTQYFLTQLNLGNVQLLSDDLKLSQSQARDIEIQLNAGSNSRLDFLSAQNDVVQKRIALRQARAQLAASLRDLFTLTGLGAGVDPQLAASQDMAEAMPKNVEAPSLVLSMDEPDASLNRLRAAESAELDLENPKALLLERLAEAAQYQANSLGSSHWPKGQVFARTSLDYPNGPLLENINQNTFGAQVAWNLFSFGQVVHQVEQQEKLSQSDSKQADQVRSDLRRDWQKAKDQLAALREQHALDEESVRETSELEGLVQSSYKAGNSSYLELQSASVRALSAKIQEVRTRIQTLMELVILDSLAKQ